MAQLNSAMQAQYDKALVRALEEGLKVSELTPITLIVTNPTNGNDYWVMDRGHALECNCQAGQRGTYCKHRAAARAYLAAKRSTVKERERVAAYKAEMAEDAAEHASERWAEQENERRLTGSLLRTDDAIALGKADAEAERVNWLGMPRDERAAWLLANS